MDRWRQRIENGQALAFAREIKTIAETTATSSPDEADHLDRLFRISDLVEWTLQNVDAWLVSDQVLASLTSHLQQGRDYLTNWKGGSGVEYLTVHAPTVLENALAILGSIPVGTTAAEASTEIASLRRSVGQHRGAVDREIEELRKAAGEAREQSSQQIGQSQTRLTELEAEVARVRDEVTQVTASSRELANQQQNAFAAAQTERQETFSKLLEEKREETTKLAAEFKSRLEEAAVKATKEIEADREAAEAAKTRIEKILGIVGEEALTGGYSKIAAEEKKSAGRWRIGALVAIVVSVGIGIWLAIDTQRAGTDWDLFAAKLVIALPAGGIAAYAARQSSEHRHTQREAEHMALQLATLKPFLDDLSADKDRDHVLTEIARRIFGRPRRDGKKEEVALLTDSPSLIAQLLPVIEKAVKTAIGNAQRAQDS